MQSRRGSRLKLSQTCIRQARRWPIPTPRQATALPYNKHAALPHAVQHLAELHRLSIFGNDLRDYAFCFRLDFIHHFHRFDNANDRFFGYLLADIDERGRVG